MTAALVVPDASVLLKWILPGEDEPDTGAALSLREAAVSGAVSLFVPQLWMYEVGNTLARRYPEQAGRLLAALVDFRITEARLDSRWREQTLSLARVHGVTFYDASYHAVALVCSGVFVTADARYVRRAQDAGGLALLRNWETCLSVHQRS